MELKRNIGFIKIKISIYDVNETLSPNTGLLVLLPILLNLPHKHGIESGHFINPHFW